jgi:hypothetical protein
MRINKAKLFRRSILVILLLGSMGLYFANRFIKSKGFDGIGHFVSNYYKNKSLADDVTPTNLRIEIEDTDYEFLKKKRQEGLDRGIQINDGNNYVPCLVILDGDTVKGEMRLKGHMTDHLQGEKWSYRVKTKEPVMGMYRFSLQHPANRNYSYEWIYHQLLKEEDVIHLQYDFLNFELNDRQLGIYAVEEHFGQHVAQRNNRPAGAILRWNPELYWERRIDELQGLYLDEQYSAFSTSFVEPYDRAVVFKDSVLTDSYYQGAKLLEEFRRGIRKTSEVFDVDRMASFHAIIDLVGGHNSLDWSDVKFFYNSGSRRIEPVGYGSFSIRKSERLAGQQALKSYDGDAMDYHALLFSDPIFYTAYIRALERICNKDYFNTFKAKIKTELDKKIGVIAHEFPYIRFDFDGYYENIDLIRHNLELPKAFHAFTKELNDSTIILSISPVTDYPIEITHLIANGKRTYGIDPVFILPAKARDTYAHYWSLTIPHDGKKMKNLTLKARIVGSSKEFEIEVKKYRYYEESGDFKADSSANASSYFIRLNDTILTLKSTEVEIRKRIELDRGMSLQLFPGQHLKFGAGGALKIESGNLIMWGTEEEEISLSADEDAKGFVIRQGKICASHLRINNKAGVFNLYDSHVSLNSSTIHDSENRVFLAERSTVFIKNMVTGTMESLGMFKECVVEMEKICATHGGDFIYSLGSEIRIRDSRFKNQAGVAQLDYLSSCRFWNTEFEENKMIGKLKNASSIKLYNCKIRSGEIGFDIDKYFEIPSESTYELTESDPSALVKVERYGTE